MARAPKTAALTGEIAGPTITGVRRPMTYHPSSGLTPQRLAEHLRASEQGNMDAYLALAEDMEEKDLHYHAVLGMRKRAVAQLEVTVEPASDAASDQKMAEMVQEFVDSERLEERILGILDAIGKGFSVTEIIWDVSESQWFPTDLRTRPPHWFAFDPNDSETLLLREPNGNIPLAPYKFIPHIHSVKSGMPIRGGLARAAAWCFLFKAYSVRDWMIFAEVYGQPLRLGKYPAGANKSEKDTLLDAVAHIGVDAAAIIPDSMMIEFQEARATTTDLHQRLADWMDRQISKAVLGQTLTTEVGSTGSLAAAKVHDGVRADIERSDAKQLAATLNRHLVRPMIDLNFGPQQWYPRIFIGRPESVDGAALAASLAQLVPLGLRVRQAEVRRKLDLAEPDPADELLASPKPGSPGPLPAEGPVDGTASQMTVVDLAAARRADFADRSASELVDVVKRAGDPLLDALRVAVDNAVDMEDVSARLLEVAGQDRTAELADRLREALVFAELRGEVDRPRPE